MDKEKILYYQNKALKALSGKIDDFYLAGGTALALFYFQHRFSVDLDFFTQRFSYPRIKEIIGYLKKVLKTKITLAARNLEKDKLKITIYNIYFSPKSFLKIDFVEDTLKLLKYPKVVEGINILSLEDIYLRKILAITGGIERFDEIGRKKFLGGRIVAKDFYDLYILSHTFMPLSKFIDKYCNTSIIKEGLIRWFYTYDRMKMVDEVLTLTIDKEIDYKKIEKHFKKEIIDIIEKGMPEL